MTDKRSLSRRQVVETLAGGAVLGGLWGAAFPAVAAQKNPSLTVIGHRQAQLIVVDSIDSRALVMVGTPDDTLLDRLPAMMTIFRQRLDLVIGSDQTLARHASSIRGRWGIRRAVALKHEPGNVSLAMPTTTVSGSARIELGHELSVTCRVEHRSEWDRLAPDDRGTVWCVEITHPAGHILIAPDMASLDATSPPATSLLIMPDAPPGRVLRRVQVGAVAFNDDTDALPDDVGKTIPLTRIYGEDIARFVLRDDEIHLPSWTRRT